MCKEYGIPDSQIILMLADDAACNPRNKFPARIFNSPKRNDAIDVYGSNVEVDYRGEDVSPNTFLRLLTGRLPSTVPMSKRLRSDRNSNILIYLTGHGGEGFIKFQDYEELSDADIADAFAEMKSKGMFNELLFVTDTCHAQSLFSKIRTPGVLGIASARVDQDSVSLPHASYLDVSVIDRFTYFALEFFRKNKIDSGVTIAEWFNYLRRRPIVSDPVIDTRFFGRDVRRVPVSDFFGALVDVRVSSTAPQRNSRVNMTATSSSSSRTNRDVSACPRAQATDERVRDLYAPDAEYASHVAFYASLFLFAFFATLVSPR